MTARPLTLPFTEIRASDLPLVGGKGANLGEMTQAGFPVPPGFCVTTAAFQQFIAACPEADEIYRLLENVPHEDVAAVRKIGEHVRQTLLQVPIPQEVETAVIVQWKQLGSENAYAVRSSATAEDLPDASFAGQQDTFLNVIGEASLLDSVRRCWVSLFTDRAIIYRGQNRFSHRDVQLSVVIQHMILAEKSGVLFTADPLSGHRHTLTIDASLGLGEALVGGFVTPDAYQVDKRTNAIIAREIADKQIAVFPKKDGGTRREILDPGRRNQTVLTDEQILTLSEMGSCIEAHYTVPQDIEWGIAGDRCYLLQARPITSLFPIEGLESPGDGLHIYFSMGHQQNMTRAITPLGLSSFPLLIPVGNTHSKFENAYLRQCSGRMFVDLTKFLRHRLLRRVVFGATSQFDALAPETLRAVMRRPEFQRPHEVHFSLSALRFIAGFFRKVMAALWRQDLTGFVERTNTIIDSYIHEMDRQLNKDLTGKNQLMAVLKVMPGIFPFFMNWIPYFVAGEMAKRLLARLAQKKLEPEEIDALTLGLPGNVVTEMNLAVGDLADIARQLPQLVAWFEELGTDGRSWLEQAAQLPGSAPFMKSWEKFMHQYGARGPAEIDIKMPRWHEEPLPLLQVVAGALQQKPGSHRLQHKKLVQAREAATTKLLNSMGYGPRRRMIMRLVKVINEVGGMREHHKFAAVRFLWVVKQILVKNAALLWDMGKLATPDDIWFLTWKELIAIWEDNGESMTVDIPRRRVRLDQYQKLKPPLVITSDGETPLVQYRVVDAPPGALLGNPVSPGVVEGVVRIVQDPQTETLNAGEILVAEFTDPGWTPLFINASGLIMEVGGMMNHGSVVAREYGIPAVVGVRAATTTLKTGLRVRLDGNRGIIEII